MGDFISPLKPINGQFRSPFANPVEREAGASRRAGKFALINLCAGGVYTFQYFPTAPIEGSRRANWEEQNTTIGTKPLFYFNRDPRRLDVPEFWLDNTDTNASLTPEIEALYALQDESCEGTPPPLLAVWGDRQERCILEEVRFPEMFHAAPGHPIRVKVSLSLKELQEDE